MVNRSLYICRRSLRLPLSLSIAALLAYVTLQPVRAIAQQAKLSVEQKNAEEFLKFGKRNAEEGHYASALYAYTQAIHSNPRYGEAYFYRGLARANSGDELGAHEDFDKVLQLRIEGLDDAIRQRPNDVLAYLQRGSSRAELKDDQGAIQDFTQAIRLDSRNADAYFYRGNARFRRGEKEPAVQDYDHALQIDPGRADIYVGRAIARLQLGDRVGAAKDFDTARSINPTDYTH